MVNRTVFSTIILIKIKISSLLAHDVIDVVSKKRICYPYKLWMKGLCKFYDATASVSSCTYKQVFCWEIKKCSNITYVTNSLSQTYFKLNDLLFIYISVKLELYIDCYAWLIKVILR